MHFIFIEFQCIMVIVRICLCCNWRIKFENFTLSNFLIKFCHFHWRFFKFIFSSDFVFINYSQTVTWTFWSFSFIFAYNLTLSEKKTFRLIKSDIQKITVKSFFCLFHTKNSHLLFESFHTQFYSLSFFAPL